MISLIKKYFYKNNSTDTDNNQSVVSDSKNITLSFQINKDGIITEILIGDLDEGMPAKLGELLFHLNEGYYAEGLLQIMKDIGDQGPEYYSFIKQSIVHWSNKVKEIDSGDDPIVSPSQFSTMVNNNAQ